MTSSVLRILGAILWGCVRGAVGAFAFSYLKIVRHWDPLILAVLFGSFEALMIAGKTSITRRKEAS
jgi:hypothetical protein